MDELDFVFFFQAEDGIRDYKVTGVQTCALPIWDVAEAAQLAADLQAVAPREHQVEQHEVGRMLAHPRHHLEAVGDAVRGETRRLQVIRHQRRQLGLVLDYEDGAHCVTGSSISTARPPSGELRALISPSCASTMLRQIARPSPAPPLARLRDPSTR